MTLTPVTINEYRHMEKAINKRYINEIKSIISDDFEHKLEKFEECELGFFNSYKYMFKVLIEDENAWNDYWNIKKPKYFSTLNTHEKLRECYDIFNRDIQNLRKQISRDSLQTLSLEEFELNLGNNEISLSTIKQHSYANILIDFGIETAAVLLMMGAIFIFSGIAGCLKFTDGNKSRLICIVTLILSIVLSIINDNYMINSIKEQYQDKTLVNYTELLNTLDKSTNIFYENLSK